MIKKWEKISSETVFEKYGRATDKNIYKMPNGNETEFYIKREGPGCGIVAITEDNRVILTKQYRPGPDEVIYDLPGGFVDPGEDPKVAMERELLEETGYQGKMQFVATTFHSSYSTMKFYCYVATECVKVRDPDLDTEEFIDIELLSLTDFRKLLRSGQMNDVAIGYLGLDHLSLI